MVKSIAYTLTAIALCIGLFPRRTAVGRAEIRRASPLSPRRARLRLALFAELYKHCVLPYFGYRGNGYKHLLSGKTEAFTARHGKAADVVFRKGKGYIAHSAEVFAVC